MGQPSWAAMPGLLSGSQGGSGWFLATGRGSRLLRAGIPGSRPQKLWSPPSLKDGWLFRHISWHTGQPGAVRVGPRGWEASRRGVSRGPLGGCCSPERPVTAWQEEAAGGPADGHWPAHAACAHRLCPRAAPKSWGRGLCSPHLSPAVLWAQFDLQLLWEAPWASWLWGPQSLAAHAGPGGALCLGLAVLVPPPHPGMWVLAVARGAAPCGAGGQGRTTCDVCGLPQCGCRAGPWEQSLGSSGPREGPGQWRGGGCAEHGSRRLPRGVCVLLFPVPLPPQSHGPLPALSRLLPLPCCGQPSPGELGPAQGHQPC